MSASTRLTPLPIDPKRWLEALPDRPFCPLPAGIIHGMVEARSALEDAVVARLALGTSGHRVPDRGYRAAFLVSLVGEWRSTTALPALVRHLDTPWGYGWDELVHAFTRIGPASIPVLLYAAFDGRSTTLARQRALRALASAAHASVDPDDEWPTADNAHYGEICAALRLMLHRWAAEPRVLVEEAALRLCGLRCREAWDEVRDLFARGVVREREGFTANIAADLVEGRLWTADLGGYGASMVAHLP
jgi:hypothetical protein